MGRRERGQGQFFYRFDLDKVVPTDHLVRQIDGVPRAEEASRAVREYLTALDAADHDEEIGRRRFKPWRQKTQAAKTGLADRSTGGMGSQEEH